MSYASKYSYIVVFYRIMGQACMDGFMEFYTGRGERLLRHRRTGSCKEPGDCRSGVFRIVDRTNNANGQSTHVRFGSGSGFGIHTRVYYVPKL